MMIVLTGATGFVGSQLVERLGGESELLVVSRDPIAASKRFPGVTTCDYASLRNQNLKGSVFIHLAARNNDRPGTEEEFRSANVDFLLEVAAIARAGGAVRFINLCTTHALEPGPRDTYGRSKHEGARALETAWPEGSANLYVPAVYGDVLQGRLGRLNSLPGPARRLVLRLLRQVKPIISIDNLLVALQELAFGPARSVGPWASEHYAADPVPEAGLYAAGKRVIDLLAVLMIVIGAGWLMLLIAVYIRIDSKGPAIFAQERVGRNGRVFTCYKFRTMAVGTAHAATHHVNAAAVTAAGGFLRRTKLDELPQIFNVLLNQMTLVGPRPCLPLQLELVARRQERGVLQLKPGITGLAQISHIDMSDPARLAAWDDRYRVFRTLLGDLVVLLRTVAGGGAGDRIAPTGRRRSPSGL